MKLIIWVEKRERENESVECVGVKNIERVNIGEKVRRCCHHYPRVNVKR